MIFYAYFFCCLSQNNYLCTLIFSLLLNMQSHPTWVRGLKQTSRLMWTCRSVAPYVGAWIETVADVKNASYSEVAPYVGAWIETVLSIKQCRISDVAPYVGAWIETHCEYQ